MSLAPARLWVLARRYDSYALVALTAACLCALYLALSPLSPDLSAQLARSGAASRGAGLWWGGWYGGINTATYSLVSGFAMSVVGVSTVGVLSTIVIGLAAADLLRGAPRARAGAVAAAVAASSNLFSGRVTYAAGMAIALMSLCLLRRGKVLAAVVLAAACGLVSPLAAVCEVLGVLSLLPRQAWRPLVLAGAAACVPVAVVDVLFGQPSYMPYPADVMLYGLLICGAVVISGVPQAVRIAAVLSGLLAIGAWLVHSPLGSNAVRTPMLAAAPLLIAYGHPARWWGRLILIGTVLWPTVTVLSDLSDANGAHSSAAYYRPLLQHLPAAGTSTQRLEVLDPINHAGSYYLSAQVPLARGWERQIDSASNPLFYDGSLSAPAYRTWLITHAVGWVAEPTSGELDYGSTDEQQLLRGGLPYLRETWHDASWRLYRVMLNAPAADGAAIVTALGDDSISFTTRAAGRSHFRVAYSALLVPRLNSDPSVEGCVSPTAEGDLDVQVPQAGDYQLLADLGNHRCPD
ncbi:MAG: hypothetical protein JWM40_2768 [Frankiales bacterium]|nr:hypothetical protein [Frankiales bacterium]